jgi:phosphoenolpyruvate carboxykinase (ATP)
VANRVPAFGLANQGISTPAKLYWNLGHSALVEEAVKRGEGVLAKDGPAGGRDRAAHRPLGQGQVHRS